VDRGVVLCIGGCAPPCGKRLGRSLANSLDFCGVANCLYCNCLYSLDFRIITIKHVYATLDLNIIGSTEGV
jgi:hypothetical protein